jgi:hypothetical protein
VRETHPQHGVGTRVVDEQQPGAAGRDHEARSLERSADDRVEPLRGG